MTLIEKMTEFKNEFGVSIKFEIKTPCGTGIDLIANGPIIANEVRHYFGGERTNNRVRITWTNGVF